MMNVSEQELVSIFNLKNTRRSGQNLLASCPFTMNHAHGDRNPSFSINTDNGLWICYGCGEKGNIYQLAESILGMSSHDAHMQFDVEMTADAIDQMMDGRRGPSKSVTPLQIDISAWSSQKHPYWAQRGFTEETIGKWRLGFDEQANRVVVPIYFKKELVGWSKRAIDDVTMPKWLHDPGMPKSEILFGMDNSSSDSVVLVEAPQSVIMLDQYGVSNAVASFGCKLSESQARLLRSNYDTVLVFYDPDEPGQKGMRDAVAQLDAFLDVYVVPPTRDDPAAMSLEEDLEALRSAIPSWALDM